MCAVLSTEMGPEFALVNAQILGRPANPEILQYLRAEGNDQFAEVVLEGSARRSPDVEGVGHRLTQGVLRALGLGRNRRPPRSPGSDSEDIAREVNLRYPAPPVIFP